SHQRSPPCPRAESISGKRTGCCSGSHTASRCCCGHGTRQYAIWCVCPPTRSSRDTSTKAYAIGHTQTFNSTTPTRPPTRRGWQIVLFVRYECCCEKLFGRSVVV